MKVAKLIAAAEAKAVAANFSVAEICKRAGIFHSVWSRAKSRGTIRPSLLRRFEAAIAEGEREAGDGQAVG